MCTVPRASSRAPSIKLTGFSRTLAARRRADGVAVISQRRDRPTVRPTVKPTATRLRRAPVDAELLLGFVWCCPTCMNTRRTRVP